MGAGLAGRRTVSEASICYVRMIKANQEYLLTRVCHDLCVLKDGRMSPKVITFRGCSISSPMEHRGK